MKLVEKDCYDLEREVSLCKPYRDGRQLENTSVQLYLNRIHGSTKTLRNFKSCTHMRTIGK